MSDIFNREFAAHEPIHLNGDWSPSWSTHAGSYFRHFEPKYKTRKRTDNIENPIVPSSTKES